MTEFDSLAAIRATWAPLIRAAQGNAAAVRELRAQEHEAMKKFREAERQAPQPPPSGVGGSDDAPPASSVEDLSGARIVRDRPCERCRSEVFAILQDDADSGAAWEVCAHCQRRRPAPQVLEARPLRPWEPEGEQPDRSKPPQAPASGTVPPEQQAYAREQMIRSAEAVAAAHRRAQQDNPEAIANWWYEHSRRVAAMEGRVPLSREAWAKFWRSRRY